MGIPPNHFKRIRKRFAVYNDRKKFESLNQRIGILRSDISFGNLDRKALESFKAKLEDILRVVNKRIKGHEP